MKRQILAMAFTAFVAALFTLGVYAQPGPGGPGAPQRPGGPQDAGMEIGMVLRNSQIKEKLNLTSDQESKLRKVAEEMRDSGRRGERADRGERRERGGERGERGERREGGPPQPPSPEEMEKRRAEMEKRQNETDDKINAILDVEQQQKFKELRFQLAGGLDSPMLNARMLEAVNITEDQKAKLQAINEERFKEFREGMERGPRPDMRGSEEDRRAFFEKMRERGEEMRKKYSEKTLAVLTAEQKTKAEKLTEEGKAFRPQRRERGEGGRDGGRGERGREGGEYRPGSDSWQPGQGAQRRGERSQRRAFPQTEGTPE